jgi:hypothetical protein
VSAVRLSRRSRRFFHNISRRRHQITGNFENFCGAAADIITYAIELNIFPLISMSEFLTQPPPPHKEL